MSHIFYKIRYDCKRRINNTVIDKNVKNDYCELIWDGIMCWPQTEAGVELSLPCPEYFGFSPQNMASKKCTESGQWFFHEEYNTTWTNYSQCRHLIDNNTHTEPIDIDEDFALYDTWLPTIQIIKQTGYSISILTLLLGIIIFSSFKRLQCARNKLHVHLFLSLVLKAITTLIKDFSLIYGTVFLEDMVQDGSNTYVKEHNSWKCKAITIFWQYFIQTNYFLILMEGFYLHNLLFSCFTSDKENISLYAYFGWGVPLIFILPWILIKGLLEDEYCWTKQNYNFQLILIIPIIVTIMINLVLFHRIIYILSLKLNTMYIQQRKMKYRRLIRSTLILMPLFGVPYIFSLTAWYPANKIPSFELIWIFFDQTFTSLQGFFVAFLYCLSNNDVRKELKKQFTMKQNANGNKRNSFPVYATVTNRFSFTIDNK